MTVDDSKPVRLTIALALKHAGYGVVEASGGAEALELLKTEKVDLVLSDLNMPEMDGIELVRRIKATESSCSIPIIMLTTELQKSRLAEARQAGAIGWMYKPFKNDQLVLAVGKVFERINVG